MSARLARTAFASATRRAPTSVPLSVARVSRRTMSATLHAPPKSSDTPWIIGSLLVFGPAFLYLLSPSARKNAHGIHNDHHDIPALKQHEGHQAPKAESAVAAVEIMKDDEGAEANITSSIALSEESDVPIDSASTESEVETFAVAKAEEAPASKELATTQEAQVSEGTLEGKEKSGTLQEKKGEEAPTAQKAAKKAAQHKD